MAWGRLFVVVEVVIPEEFLAGGDVAQGKDPDAPFDLVDLAVRVAGMIQVRSQAFSVDNGSSGVMRGPSYSTTRVPLRIGVVA